MDDWYCYKNLLTAYGETPKEREIEMAKEQFLDKVIKNPGYMEDCKRNGVPQRFLAVRTDAAYKYKFVAFPDEEIDVGDLIECKGEMFIVDDPPRVLDEITFAATARLCNMKLRWQNFDSEVHESWASLDSGVFSTTIAGIDAIQVPDKQFKLYLPLNEDTSKIYLNKRIAVDSRYDSSGELILETYKVTGINKVAKSFGKGGHLLILDLRSSSYSPHSDNFEELICDYIEPNQDVENNETELLRCEIVGRPTIVAGNKRKYTSAFFDSDGNEDNTVVGMWSVTPDLNGVSYALDDNDIVITVANKDELIGESFTIELSADGYQPATLNVEVVS